MKSLTSVFKIKIYDPKKILYYIYRRVSKNLATYTACKPYVLREKNVTNGGIINLFLVTITKQNSVRRGKKYKTIDILNVLSL